jgi:hypothetical protein
MEEITKTIKLYKGTVPIKFITDYADKHEYYNEKDERLKGVTYFTGVIDKSRPLIMWAVGLSRDFLLDLLDKGKTISIDHILEASKQHTKVKEEAADTGKQIHAWISRWINKEKKNDIPDDPKVRQGITVTEGRTVRSRSPPGARPAVIAGGESRDRSAWALL